MKHIDRFSGLLPILALGFSILACSLAPGGSGGGPSVDPHAIATYVAGTVQAQVAQGANPGQTATEAAHAAPVLPTTTPTSIPSLLPSGLYFIGTDKTGLDQVWRVPPEGYRVDQVTAEPASVSDFAISPDGNLAYIVNNRLILKRPGYVGTTVVADGGKDDGSDAFRFSHKIAGLAWTPDGLTLAYGLNGVHLLRIGTGEDVTVLTNDLLEQNGAVLPITLYRPDRWSPDGSRLAVVISFQEGGTVGIFSTTDRQLVKLQKSNGEQASCCTVGWAPDGKTLLLAGVQFGLTSADLWRYDAVDGKGTQLIPAHAPDGTYTYVDWPALGPDGSLYYFYTGQPSLASGAVTYQMVRSAADGVTGRTVLQPNPLYLSEALWAADASLAVVVSPAPDEQTPGRPSHGPITILYSDGRPPKQIVRDGRRLAWGQ
jgi:hypothetical protein